MIRFKITQGFLLQSHKPTPRSMMIGEYYQTEDEAQITELQKFAAQGSCVEQNPTPKAEAFKPAEPQVSVEEDLSAVPGIGKRTLEKLTAAGIATKSQLKAFVTEKADEAKELLGVNFEKILTHLEQ